MSIYDDNLFLESNAPVAYTDNTLNEGFVQKWFTGVDNDHVSEIEGSLARGITSETQRKRIIDKIDEAINDAHRVWTFASFGTFLATIGLNFIAGGLGSILYIVGRAAQSDQRKAYRDLLNELRTKVAAVKIKD